MKKFLKNQYIIGSIIVTAIYFIFLIIGKIYPFGKNTILTGDLHVQYIDFFCYLREILKGTKGIFLSWNLGMANDFYSNFFWQLSNPINILVLLFNTSNMYICIELIIYIKLLLIFNSFIFYAKKEYYYKDYSTILFGIAYTFSSYVIIYFFNVMWLDVLYVLPLSIVFIKNYIKTGKLYPVIISYIYMLFIQYYMAYSMIIFCSIYYIAIFWMQEKINIINIKKFIRKTIPIALCTILAVGTAMIIFIPTLELLSEITKVNSQFINTTNLDLLSIINNFTNKFEFKETQKIGFMFSGSLITILIMVFFINKNIKIKEKIIYSLLIIFMLLPVISPFIYRLWHGGTSTHGYNFRYGYILIFIFVTIANRAYQKIDLSNKKFIVIYIFLNIMTILSVILSINNLLYGDHKYYLRILFSAIIMFTITIILFVYSGYITKGKNTLIIFILLMTIEVIDLYIVFYYNNSSGISISEYNFSDNIIQEVINKIERPETERILTDIENSENESLKYGYSSFYFFSSGRRLETLLNLNKIGYKTNYNIIDNTEKTLINDMLSGTKYYVLNKQSIDMNNISNYNNFLEFIEKVDNYNIYKNNYSFPFAYYIKRNIEPSGNIFETQNQILEGYGKEIKEKYIYNIKDENDIIDYKKEKEKIDDKDSYFNNKIKYEIIAKKDTDIYLNYTDDKIIKLVLNSEKEIKDYIYLGETHTSSLITWPPNSIEKYYSNNSIEHIVTLKKGENYSFEVVYNDEELCNSDIIEIYAFDDQKIKDKINSVNQDNLNIKRIGKNDMEMDMTVEDEGIVCFEISYDEGWHIEIDGEEAKTEAIYGCFLGTNISKGEHNLKIYYIPKGFKEGAIISILSLALLTVALTICKKGYIPKT